MVFSYSVTNILYSSLRMTKLETTVCTITLLVLVRKYAFSIYEYTITVLLMLGNVHTYVMFW